MTDRTDEVALGRVIATILADQGYVIYWNGRSPAVYQLGDQPERVPLGELTATVRPLLLDVLDDAATDARIAAGDRQTAEATARFIREAGSGATSYIRTVVDYAREWLPEVDRATVAPPRDNKEYMRNWHAAERRSRAAARAEAEGLVRQMLPQLLESGEYEVSSVWAAWRDLLNTDHEVLETYPALMHLGRNHFYAVLTSLDGVTVHEKGGRHRVIRVP